MSKHYADGYDLGQRDGTNGENRLPMRAWVRSLTNVGSYLPGATNRDDEWIKGYRQGLEDKVRDFRVSVSEKDGNMVATAANHPLGAADNDPPTGGGTGGINSFTHRIAVARNLYEQANRLQSFLHQTENDFRMLFSRHDLLAGEFFNDLLNYHIKPRAQQIAGLAENVRAADLPKMQALVQKYEQAILGKERGQAAATAYFASIALRAADQLSGLTAAVGAGDPRDYGTQLETARSVRRVFEGLLSQLDALGRAYDACARDHDELMRQDFDALIRQNINPRLQEISDLWRTVRDRDLAGIDDVISRLQTVSSV